MAPMEALADQLRVAREMHNAMAPHLEAVRREIDKSPLQQQPLSSRSVRSIGARGEAAWSASRTGAPGAAAVLLLEPSREVLGNSVASTSKPRYDVTSTSSGTRSALEHSMSLIDDKTTSQEHHRTPRREPYLPLLRTVIKGVEGDAVAHIQNIGHWKNNGIAIATQIATMRQDLRGKFLANVPLLSLEVLTAEEQFWLVGKLRPWNYDVGDAIIREGEMGNDLFIIERGICEVWKETDGRRVKLCNVRKGDCFGELAVMYDMPRSATVIAQTDVTVLSLCRDDIFSTISKDKLDKMKVLARTQVISSIPLLAHLDTTWKVLLASSFRSDTWPEGIAIFREGQVAIGPTRRLYIIEKGRCTVSQLAESLRHDIIEDMTPISRNRKASVFLSNERTCHAGSYFGMLEVLYGCPKQSSLLPVTDTTTLSISYDELMALFGTEGPSVLEAMKRSVRIHLLEQVHPLLKQSSEEEVASVLDEATTQHYVYGDIVFSKGDRLERISMLEAGTCIQYDGDAAALRENTFGSVDCQEHNLPGDTFGTRSVISKGSSRAPFTLVAISDCTMFQISKQSLEGLTKFEEYSLSHKPHVCVVKSDKLYEYESAGIAPLPPPASPCCGGLDDVDDFGMWDSEGLFDSEVELIQDPISC